MTSIAAELSLRHTNNIIVQAFDLLIYLVFLMLFCGCTYIKYVGYTLVWEVFRFS